MLVGDGVGRDHVLGDAVAERIIGRVGLVEAVAAVRIEREARDRRAERVGQDRAAIHVAVVGRDAAGHGRRSALGPAGRVGHRNRRVVGAGDGDGDHLGVAAAKAVADGGGEGVEGGRALGQRLRLGVELVERVGPRAGRPN